MNNQSVLQLSSYKVAVFSSIALLACVSLSFVLMKSGLIVAIWAGLSGVSITLH
jgi:hypothetical protein